MGREFVGYDNVDTISMLRKTYKRVPKKQYIRAERIRNYILRTNYEKGTDIFTLKLKAAKLFNVSEDVVEQSLHEFRGWFYDNGRIHRPIEKFIKDEKQRQRSIKIITRKD